MNIHIISACMFIVTKIITLRPCCGAKQFPEQRIAESKRLQKRGDSAGNPHEGGEINGTATPGHVVVKGLGLKSVSEKRGGNGESLRGVRDEAWFTLNIPMAMEPILHHSTTRGASSTDPRV